MTEPEPAALATAPTRAPLRRWRRWLPRAVFESVLIVFSVFLALGLSQWAEDRRTAHRVAEMRSFLIAEIQANRQDLSAPYYIPHHEALKEAFARAGGMPNMEVTRASAEPAITKLFSEGGLRLPQQRDAVWTSVSSSDLFAHMEAEEVFALAQVYKAQEGLEGLNRAGYENAVGLLNILSDERNAHRDMMRMTLYLEDLLQQERALLRIYDQALDRLGVPPTAPAATAKDDGAAPTG